LISLLPHQFHRIERLDQIEAHRDEWVRFATQCPLAAPFCSPLIWIPWLEAFPEHPPVVFELRRDGQLAALLPMYRDGQRLEVATAPHLDYQDIAAVDPEAAVALILEIIESEGQNGVTITFAKVADHSLLTATLRDPRIAAQAHLQSRYWSVCPTVSYALRDPDDFLQSVTPRQRKDYRSAGRRLRQAAPAQVVEHRRGRGIDAGMIAAAADLHVENQHRKKGDSVFARQAFSRFLEGQTAADAPICLSLLREREGGPLLAFSLGYFSGDTYFYYLTAYSGQHADCSPGRWLLVDTLRHWSAHTRGGRLRLDLLCGDESYKSRWATGFYEVSRVQLIPKRLGNLPRAVAYTAVYGLKNAKNRLRNRVTGPPLRGLEPEHPILPG
jgi:CelD/BcsL family acetyltransferase involved in cellulose biosynthesis